MHKMTPLSTIKKELVESQREFDAYKQIASAARVLFVMNRSIKNTGEALIYQNMERIHRVKMQGALELKEAIQKHLNSQSSTVKMSDLCPDGECDGIMGFYAYEDDLDKLDREGGDFDLICLSCSLIVNRDGSLDY